MSAFSGHSVRRQALSTGSLHPATVAGGSGGVLCHCTLCSLPDRFVHSTRAASASVSPKTLPLGAISVEKRKEQSSLVRQFNRSVNQLSQCATELLNCRCDNRARWKYKRDENGIENGVQLTGSYVFPNCCARRRFSSSTKHVAQQLTRRYVKMEKQLVVDGFNANA